MIPSTMRPRYNPVSGLRLIPAWSPGSSSSPRRRPRRPARLEKGDSMAKRKAAKPKPVEAVEPEVVVLRSGFEFWKTDEVLKLRQFTARLSKAVSAYRREDEGRQGGRSPIEIELRSAVVCVDRMIAEQREDGTRYKPIVMFHAHNKANFGELKRQQISPQPPLARATGALFNITADIAADMFFNLQGYEDAQAAAVCVLEAERTAEDAGPM